MRPIVLLVLIVLIVGLQFGLLGCGPERLADGPAPDFQFRDLKTQSTLGKKNLAGHPVVIDFWETWCAPCRQTMPEVQRLQEDYEKSGVKVVGVSDESQETVAKFVQDRSLTYSFALDPGGNGAKLFGVDGFPTLILLDGEGNIVYRASPPDFQDVRTILDRMVKG